MESSTVQHAPISPFAREETCLARIQQLSVTFQTDQGAAHAVDGVSFDLKQGETLALVGESGCGKSVTALSMLRLIPSPPGRIAAGSIWFDGQDLLALSERRMREIRGNTISMVFQEPMTSLNPVFRIGDQISAVLRLHQGASRTQSRTQAIDLLRRVGIPAPEKRLDDYPHQMSGGMLQRVMIAMALACAPKLLIADEPTTALDVTVQAQILELLMQLQQENGLAILLITHDLGVVAEIAHRVAVMYAGRIVETAAAADLFATPLHPYTQGLFASLPGMNAAGKRLAAIPGMVPAATHFPTGCRFHPRCSHAMPICRVQAPRLISGTGPHLAACWLHQSAEATQEAPKP